MKKPVRTISGIAVVAVMTSPHRCPHGRCMMCPRGVGSPQSYTGKEPAAMRAIQYDFDPYLQTSARLRRLSDNGHPVGKVELIVMGGTITARARFYQRWFVRRCLEAMNDFGEEKRSGDHSILLEQRRNEHASVRNIGITFETRPDHSKEKEVDDMLSIGVTKVELGVQHVWDDILEGINRGHKVKDTIEANKILRNSGLKVGFHIMPGLPGSDPDDDIQMFKRIYEDDDFKPDYIKIYPTLVIKGTELYERWRAGTYEPISDEDAAVLIARVKEMLPRWTRLQRVQRDIPSQYIDAGVKKSNLRQLAKEKAKNCACIRCREVGHALLDGRSVNKNKIELLNQKYDACEGTEYFLSYEDVENDILIGFLRLRLTSDTHREELKNSALVRDLHVYGRLVPVGEKSMNKWQHKGYGASLLENAEYIASDEGFKKISVMSGVGVREYYSKFGYERDGPFMSKVIA